MKNQFKAAVAAVSFVGLLANTATAETQNTNHVFNTNSGRYSLPVTSDYLNQAVEIIVQNAQNNKNKFAYPTMPFLQEVGVIDDYKRQRVGKCIVYLNKSESSFFGNSDMEYKVSCFDGINSAEQVFARQIN